MDRTRTLVAGTLRHRCLRVAVLTADFVWLFGHVPVVCQHVRSVPTCKQKLVWGMLRRDVGEAGILGLQRPSVKTAPSSATGPGARRAWAAAVELLECCCGSFPGSSGDLFWMGVKVALLQRCFADAFRREPKL